MKRTFMGAVAAIALAAPMTAIPSFANAAPGVQSGVHYDRSDRGDDNARDDRGHDRNSHYDQSDRRNDSDGRYDQNGRGDRRNYEASRWDNSAHNGYKYKGRWHYGPPPSRYEGRHGVEVGYHTWRKGERLPRYYRDRYEKIDYRAERYREPPRGYHYVRDDRGETLLVGITTGIILGVILSGN